MRISSRNRSLCARGLRSSVVAQAHRRGPDRQPRDPRARSFTSSPPELLALLAELDVRRLYLAQSCASLFTFCTQVLHLSEHAAYHRIEVARAARQFPLILDLIADGAVTLTTVALLRPHLTPDNHVALLEAARHKSKRDVEHQIACLAPRSDERSALRRLPAVGYATPAAPAVPSPSAAPSSPSTAASSTRRNLGIESAPRTPVELKPLSPERYALKVTLTAEAYLKLRRAQDLMRHSVPTGDASTIVDRALTMLVDALERAKFGSAMQPRGSGVQGRAMTGNGSRTRYVPAEICREVWARDEGRCAFVGERGRCQETGRLEFHHVIPLADGGVTTVENLALQCQAHNRYEMELWSPTDACLVHSGSAQ